MASLLWRTLEAAGLLIQNMVFEVEHGDSWLMPVNPSTEAEAGGLPQLETSLNSENKNKQKALAWRFVSVVEC